jgi:curli production assembly/transport component CsgF
MSTGKTFTACAIAALCLAESAFAAPLVYTPVNPSFGGNPNNIATLQLGSRQQSNKEKQPVSSATIESAADQIASQIQNSVLARLSSQIAENIYGDNAQPSGTADLGGGNSISWSTTGSIITVLIVGGDGSSTTLELPVI